MADLGSAARDLIGNSPAPEFNVPGPNEQGLERTAFHKMRRNQLALFLGAYGIDGADTRDEMIPIALSCQARGAFDVEPKNQRKLAMALQLPPEQWPEYPPEPEPEPAVKAYPNKQRNAAGSPSQEDAAVATAENYKPSVEDMSMQELRKAAKAANINSFGMKKERLVKALQDASAA